MSVSNNPSVARRDTDSPRQPSPAAANGVNPTLVLASSSPYRRMLLQRLALPFECVAPEIDESVHIGEQPQTYVSRLARAKAQRVAELLQQDQTTVTQLTQQTSALIIGSDQALVLDQQIISKPENHAGAVAMLQRCSGQTVTFHCGWSLLQAHVDGNIERIDAAVVPTEVVFRDLSETEILRYIEREPALDCAGAFKSEALGISLFAALRSDDPSALIGLPLISLCHGLRKAGLALP
jgi:septum formation protein